MSAGWVAPPSLVRWRCSNCIKMTQKYSRRQERGILVTQQDMWCNFELKRLTLLFGCFCVILNVLPHFSQCYSCNLLLNITHFSIRANMMEKVKKQNFLKKYLNKPRWT